MIWSIIFSSLSFANPDDIEDLGNTSNSSSQKSEQSSKKEKQKKSQSQDKEEQLEEERLEEELLEEEREYEENLEKEYLEEEQRLEEEMNQQNEVDDHMFGTPNDLTHQEQLDPYLFETNATEDQETDEAASEDQRWWKSFRKDNSENTDDSNDSEALHQAVYDETTQEDVNDQEKQDFEADQATYDESIRQKYQQNLSKDEILFSSLQQNTSQESQETAEDLAPNFGSEYKGEQDPNTYKSGLTTYQTPQMETKESDGFNPYN